MAFNPFPYGDPRYWQFEQQEQLRKQVKEASDRQEDMARNQSIELAAQTEYLHELSEPQRQRQAILDDAAKKKEEAIEKARQQQIAKWMQEAPAEVCRACEELTTILNTPIPKRPLNGKEIFAWGWIGIVLLADCGGLGVILIGKNFGDMPDGQVGAIMVPLAILLVAMVPALSVIRARTKEEAAQKVKRSKLLDQRQAVINNFLAYKQAHAERYKPAADPMPTTQDCPFCQETIKIGAKKCKHCGELL